MSDEISRYFSQIGRKGGKASGKALSKRQRVERAKKARAAQLNATTSKKGGAK